MKNRDRYLTAYSRAEQNEQRDRDLYAGIPNAEQDFFTFLKSVPSVEAIAVNDFIDGRFSPPR